MLLDEKESKLKIAGPAGALEVTFSRGNSDISLLAETLPLKNSLVVICHPHPQRGGTMDNKVVTTLMRTYRDLGVHVVRFNFRGVGGSEGVFDNARGELQDLLAVVEWAKTQLPQCRLLLAGFSFGSSIAARASYLVGEIRHLTLVAPPVERYDYDRAKTFVAPVCVVQGDKDELVVAAGVYDWVKTLLSPVELIRYPEADHFFHGYLSALKTDLTASLLRQVH